jgi:hypothetical protein
VLYRFKIFIIELPIVYRSQSNKIKFSSLLVLETGRKEIEGNVLKLDKARDGVICIDLEHEKILYYYYFATPLPENQLSCPTIR